MMEQDYNSLKDQEVKGAIDMTSLSSPGPAHSSGYCSEEDHCYSSSNRSKGGSGTLSPGISSPSSHTPSGVASPDSEGPPGAPGMGGSSHPGFGGIPPGLLEEKMQEFSTEDLNLDQLIDDFPLLVDPVKQGSGIGSQSDMAQVGTAMDIGSSASAMPPSSISQTASWGGGLDNDIEMMDMDGTAHADGSLASMPNLDQESILKNLLKEVEEKEKQAQREKERLSPVEATTVSQTPFTTAIMTQSNVMLSSAAAPSNQMTPGYELEPQLARANKDVPLTSIAGLQQTSCAGLPAMGSSPFLGSGKLDPSPGNVAPDFFSEMDQVAMKIAENVVNQQLGESLDSYLTGLTSTGSSLYGVADAGLDTSNSYLLTEPYLGVSSSPHSQVLPVTGLTSQALPSNLQPSCSSNTYHSSPAIVTASPLPTSVTIPSSSNSHCRSNSSMPPGVIRITNSKILPNKANLPQVTKVTVTAPQSQARRPQQLPQSGRSSKSSSGSSRTTPRTSPTTPTTFPGLDDHRYTSRQPESPKGITGMIRHGNKASSRSPSSSHPQTMLEQFLLTKEKLNPNKGSEAALAAVGISELQLSDLDSQGNVTKRPQLLKKLLTGEMDKHELRQCEEKVIEDRRQSLSSPQSDDLPVFQSEPDPYDITQSLGMDLLGADTGGEMDKLWSSAANDEVGILWSV